MLLDVQFQKYFGGKMVNKINMNRCVECALSYDDLFPTSPEWGCQIRKLSPICIPILPPSFLLRLPTPHPPLSTSLYSSPRSSHFTAGHSLRPLLVYLPAASSPPTRSSVSSRTFFAPPTSIASCFFLLLPPRSSLSTGTLLALYFYSSSPHPGTLAPGPGCKEMLLPTVSYSSEIEWNSNVSL